MPPTASSLTALCHSLRRVGGLPSHLLAQLAKVYHNYPSLPGGLHGAQDLITLFADGVTTQPLSLPEELVLMLLNEESGYSHQVPG